jgi:SAM-dependent methyltransferase
MDLSGLPIGSPGTDASCPACPSEDATKCCGAPGPPAGKPLSAGWDGMSGWYTQWMSPGTASVTASLFGHAGLLSPSVSQLNVLETHCGDARAAAGLLPCPSVASYTAADFSEGMLAAAQANLGANAKTVVADSTRLPFADGSFDRYICNLGLCCTPDFTASLTEACRVLTPGGVAAMSMRIEGGEGDTSMKLINDTLTPFGMGPGPDREGVQIGKDLDALRARVHDAGFVSAVAWRTFATLPIHDVSTFMECVTTVPYKVYCQSGLLMRFKCLQVRIEPAAHSEVSQWSRCRRACSSRAGASCGGQQCLGARGHTGRSRCGSWKAPGIGS